MYSWKEEMTPSDYRKIIGVNIQLYLSFTRVYDIELYNDETRETRRVNLFKGNINIRY